MKSAIVFALLLTAAGATVGPYSQCGGQGYTGDTACTSGYTCVVVNQWWSQCAPGGGSSSSSSFTSTTTGATTPTSGAGTKTGKLKWLGVDESGAEWGTTFPGTAGVDYIFPDTAAIGTLIQEGYNIFRVPFAMERMAVGSLTAALNSAYLTPYTAVIQSITSAGAYAVIDAHNYGRYNGAIITDTTGFKTFWQNLASQFKGNTKVIFDINNEYNQMDQTLVFDLNQAGIDGIRASGATSQYIFAEGNSWSGASTWSTVNDNLKGLSDPSNLLVYEMHQYLNSDGSGATEECASSTVGVDRVSLGTSWLKANGKLGVLGEFAAGPSTSCLSAVTGLLDHMTDNSDVWLGAIWWSAGPGWPADYYADFEPPSGIAYNYYDSTLLNYVP